MSNSITATALSATPQAQEILAVLLPHVATLLGLVQAFGDQPLTPERTCTFERDLQAAARHMCRQVVEHTYNHLEPEQLQDCPLRLRCAGEEYRRRPKSPNDIGTLFGVIKLRRYLYEAVEPGQPCLFPLELQLGIEAGLATPALAERVGWWSAEHEQAQVLQWLEQAHAVSWSVKSLRKLTASLRAGLASFREAVQATKVLALLTKAEASRGRHRPVLALGRDGINVPIRGAAYQEGATATLSVLDRRGRRLGTVYLGHMPESGQGTLSAQMTGLVTKVLAAWHDLGQAMPRLAYVTDAGYHPKEYHKQVLRRLPDPWRPGQCLPWQWVPDFWHACGYVYDLAEALSGSGDRAYRCFVKWRRWLRDRHQGVTQVLRSAMWYYNNGRALSKAREEAFWEAYRYLRKHSEWMRYADYRRQGLPIGSGVTEAACKTVFAERLKRSGMTWSNPGGQVIVDLRVLVLSGVWQEAHAAYLASRPQPEAVAQPSCKVSPGRILRKAA